MDQMTSSEFRRRYASLSRPVEVTVNGHPIGTWQPTYGAVSYNLSTGEIRPQNAAEEEAVERFFARSRPAPKPSQKGK